MRIRRSGAGNPAAQRAVSSPIIGGQVTQRMSLPTETLLKAFALLAAEPLLYRTVEELHLHFAGEDLSGYPAHRVPGVVLRWLHCYSDLELWHEALQERQAPSDIEQAIELAARLEELGIEAENERPCHECDYRGRCL